MILTIIIKTVQTDQPKARIAINYRMNVIHKHKNTTLV